MKIKLAMLALLASMMTSMLGGCGGAGDSSDLSVTGEGQATTVASGGTVTFKMTVCNNGPDGASNIAVTNTLGRGLTLVQLDCAANGGAACPGEPANNMTVSSMPNGSSLVFTVKAQTAVGINGTLNNTLAVRVVGDKNTENNTGTASVNSYSANINVNYRIDEAVAAGTDATFVATVANAGPGDARDVAMQVSLPPGYALKSLVCEATDTAVCPAVPALQMTTPLLPVGSSLRFRVTVPTTVETRGEISSQFSVNSVGDPDSVNNVGSAKATLVSPTANLVANHTVPASVVAGTTATFQATVSNFGPNNTINVPVSYRLPEGFNASEVTCTAAAGGICPSRLGYEMTVPTLPVGGSVRFAVKVPVPSTQRGDITAVFSAATVDDPSSSDNARAATTTILAPNANLGTNLIVAANTNAGANANFTASATNFGPDTSRNVSLALTLPQGYAIGTITCTAVGAVTCPATPSANMTVAEIAAGASLRFSIAVPVPLEARGAIAAQFSANAAGDPAPDNNSKSASTTAVTPPANLSVNHFVPTTVSAGSNAVFTATVTNSGPNESRNLKLDFNLLTSGYAVSSVTCREGTGGVCPSSPSVNMTVPSLAVGAALQFRITVPVALGQLGELQARFSATADGDAANDNNTAVAITSVVQASANIAVTNSVSAATAVGATAPFTVIVYNIGPTEARDVALTFTPSSGFSVAAPVACTAADGATCPAALGVGMTLPPLPIGGTLRFVFNVPVGNAAIGGVVAATAQATYTGDPDTSNNVAAASTSIVKAPDPRNGDYRTYSSNGRLYTLTVDFDAQRYVVSGTGLQASGAFTLNNGTYTVAGNARFRVQQDLLVGSLNFGDGVEPFIAARSFATTTADAIDPNDGGSGVINLFSRISGTGGQASRYVSARWSGGALQICGVDSVAITSCEAASLVTYNVAINGENFSGLSSDGQAISFRVARSGSSRILLRAEAGNNRIMSIGLGENTGPSSATVEGGSSTGQWGSTQLSSSRYDFNGVDSAGRVLTFTASLANGAAGSPRGIRFGTRSPGDTGIVVMFSGPVAVVMGTRDGGANGLMELGVP